MMGSLQADIGELSHHLKQERLFVDAEKQQIQNLNEKVTKAIERAYHASWVRGEQRRNYDDLILRPQHSSPPACCQRVNLLNTLNFVDAYKVLGYNESLYGDFLSVLRNDPHVVARCLVLGEAHNQEAMQTAAHTIFATVYASGLLPEDETHILNLLKHLSELQLAPSENPRRQLRHGSCAFSQIYRAYVEMLPQSKVFLTAALHQPIIQLLMEDELFLDIDPSKAAVRFPPEERLRRFGEEGTPEYAAALGKYRAWTISKLVKITNRFIESIKEAMNCFPGSLSWLVRILYDVLLTAKVTEMREVSAICVDLIFGLFLCPALVTPEPHGICDAPISYISRFNLMQVAQILQVLAMSRWETPDHRLNDLYSQFDKEIVASLLDNIIEQEGSENPPCLVGYNNPLLGLERSSFLCPEPNIMSLISFIQTLLPEFPEDDESRKEIEAILSRIKPPPPKSSNRASTSTPPNISPTTANSSTTPNTISPSVTPSKKNLLGRVKSNRLWDEVANGTLIVSQAVKGARSSKSQSEGGDGDSLKSGEDTSSNATNSSSGGIPNSASGQGLGGSTEEAEVESPALEYDTVLVISLRGAGGFSDCPGLMAEEKVLNSLQQTNKTGSRVRIDEDSASNGGDVTIEKRTRFSLSHDEGSIGNTSDNLEAISEAASNHSVASSLDDVEQEDQPDNLSDMVSANVSGRGTPNVSGRDTPSSQITEGETEEMRRIAEQQPPPPNIPVTVPKPARADIEEKFGRFEIKPLIGGDETTSMVSDTWSTDVLASDSETIEAADRSDRGDQFHDQLLNRHLAELDSMQGSYLGGEGGETFETASEAWSTDVLASDSERLQEFDTDDAQSVTRSDDTGRSEVDGDMGRDDLVGEDLMRPEQFYRNKDDNVTPRAHSSRSPVDGAFGPGGLRGGLSPVVGGILKPTPSHPSPLTLGESAHSSGHTGVMPTTGILKPIPRRDSHDSAASSGVVAASTPPRVEFHPIHPPPPQTTHEIGGPLLDSGVGAPSGGPQDNMVSSATQSLGKLSLNLSDLPNNGCVQADKHLLLNSFIGDANSTGPLIDLGSGPTTHEGGVGIGVSSAGGHKLLHSDRGSGEDSSLHLSTTSLASSSSSEKSGQQPYDSTGSDVGGGGSGSGGKIRSISNASASSGGGQDGISNDSVDTPEPSSAPVISGSPSMAATGAIPKSISFDKTAERGDKDSIDGDAKHKRGFFKNFKLPGFKGRRKPGSSTRTGDELPYVRPGVEVAVRRALSEDSRPPIIEESSDDILARYRSKKPNLDTSEPDSGIASAEQGISSGDLAKTEEDERLYVDPANIEASYAFADAKRKLRLVLSIADFSTSPQPTAGDRRGLTDNDILLWLQSQLAEAINLHDRSLVAQLHETIRCVQLFDAQGRGQLISCLRSDYNQRSPYVSYLVRSRQGLLTILAHMDKLNDRISVDANVICNSMVGLCVRLFLEKRDKLLSEFTYDFTQLTVPDEKVQLVENFLTKLYGELERDPMWISSTEEQLLIAQLALERIVMSHIYIHALYPNGDGDVSRDQVLHEHMKKLGAIITPNHKDLRITKIYQYECPWPSAQAEIVQISAYKTARDKIKCVVRASRTIMNLLSLAHDQSVPAADDFLPVLVYVLIKANPPALLSTVQYVNLFYEQRIEGEDQYWWTQFCSAIEFIKIQIYMTKFPKSS